MKLKAFVLFALFSVLILSGCKQLTKAKDLLVEPSARELYARTINKDTFAYAQWQQSYKQALYDEVEVKMPYVEKGFFRDSINSALTYGLELYEGEIFHAEIETENPDEKVFLDLLKVENDSLNTVSTVAQNNPEENYLKVPLEQSADYKLIVQPALETQTAFTLKIYRTPSYIFPVAGKGNAAIQSFYGAQREGGRRRHEGVDIFADRGTPVVAACPGRIRNTGDRGLGGKQVWLRGDLYGNSLYYAHLDSIVAQDGKRVKAGDTLGFVGNTGNARSTPPHLHFGVYKSRRGAVDPQAYIFEGAAPLPSEEIFTATPQAIVNAAMANLRASASISAKKLGRAQRGDTLKLIGQSSDWYHVRTQQQRVFIHTSLVSELAN